MFKSFIKSTVRNLQRNKTYSFLNIFGLAIGIACAALIFLWAEDELSYDSSNIKRDNLYFIRENQTYDSYIATFGSTPGPMGPEIQAQVPGVANTARMYDDDYTLFTINNKPLYTSGIYADSSLFSMFTLPFVDGDEKNAFAKRYSLVITQSAAIKYFGTDKNVVGKNILVDNRQNYTVSGVIKDIPANSTFRFEWVAPFDIVYEHADWMHEWGNNSISTIVELQPGASLASANKVLYNLIQQHIPESTTRPFLWNMNQWHLYDQFDNGKPTGGGQIEYVHLFTLIAWIILLIACINFMNLATARSEKRSKEVGVRKVLGAGKKSLVLQFIGEALIMAFLSSLLAVIVVKVALPAFNTLVQKDLSIGLNQPSHFIALLSITLLCGLVAGSYPSLYLSSFNPVLVLKGLKLKAGSANIIRKGLVVLQFSISVILIICTVIIFQQIQHVKDRNLGFNKNNLLQVEAQGDVGKYYNALKQSMLNSGVVEDVALSDHNTLYGGNNTGSITWEGKPAGSTVLISHRDVTPGFLHTSGMQLREGRDFTATDSMNKKNLNIIITSSLEKLISNGSAVGKTLRNQGDTSGAIFTVIGVVDDYVYGNMYGKPDPVIFICTAPANCNKMYVRLKQSARTETALATIGNLMKKANAAYPFTYHFVDDQFNNMFQNEMLISQLSRIFAALAIIISCLGLFGLAAYTAERRTKEIGIRKVLGASVSGITTLLSKDFLQLVGLSCIVAFPLAWWLMSGWLQNYQYRIEISWWIFVAAGLVAMLIAFFTISFQSVKAATANPVKSLRSE